MRTSIVTLVPPVSGPKSKKRGSIYIGPLEKIPAFEPSRPGPSPANNLFIKAVAAMRGLQGDVTSDEATLLASFLTQPSSRITSICIKDDIGKTAIPPVTMFLYFLTIARRESTWNPGAITIDPADTSTGTLQLNKGTYFDRQALASRLLSLAPASTRAKIILWQARIPGSYLKQYDPLKDKSQGLHNYAQLVALVKRAEEQWMWTTAGWIPRPMTSGYADTFKTRYAHELSNERTGLLALMSAYHTMGFSFLKKRPNLWTHSRVSGRDSIRTDQQFFLYLSKQPGVQYLLDAAVGQSANTKGTGDIGDMGSEFDINLFPDVIAYNSWVASRYPTISNPIARHTAFVTSRFQKWRASTNSPHKGVDLRARVIGSPIFAVGDGFISRIQPKWSRGKGWGKNIVIVCDSDGAAFRYAHLSNVFGNVGDRVKQGQIIGLSGKTGTSTPHLHLEYYPFAIMSKPADPLSDELERWKRAVN